MKKLLASAFCLLLGTAALLFAWRYGRHTADLGPGGENIMAATALTMCLSYAAAIIIFASWRGTRERSIKSHLNPGMDAETLRLRVKAGVYGLNPGASYRVIREIKDCYGNVFPVGMLLTFVQRDFVPYHGGHTVVFQPQTMYLQDEENADLLSHLDAYLEFAPYGGSEPPFQPGY